MQSSESETLRNRVKQEVVTTEEDHSDKVTEEPVTIQGQQEDMSMPDVWKELLKRWGS